MIGVSLSNLATAICVHWLLHQFAQWIMEINNTKSFLEALTQLVYWLYRALKKIIQFPSVLSVSGASRRQIPGICPLKRARATSSSSLLIPTSPAKAWKDSVHLSASLGQAEPDWLPLVAVSSSSSVCSYLHVAAQPMTLPFEWSAY